MNIFVCSVTPINSSIINNDKIILDWLALKLQNGPVSTVSMCPIPCKLKDLFPVPAMSNEYENTCPIGKGSDVFSIKFTKNAPCEVGIRGVKKKKWTKDVKILQRKMWGKMT